MSGSEVENEQDLATQQLHDARILLAGTQLAGRFTIKKQLGAGAQGHVYQVHDELLAVDVAIKLLPTQLSAPQQLEQIRHEVNLARQLQHPNIVRVHDVFCDSTSLFFTMSLIEGEPLLARIQQPVSVAEYQRWAEQLLDAIKVCQQKGIFHGDIKPDNLLINANNDLVLIDFGIGQHTSDIRQQTSGHSEYSAPEVLQSGITSQTADLYSVGIVLKQIIDAVHVNASKKKDRAWRETHNRFIATLTHQHASQRPSPDAALDTWHTLFSDPLTRKRVELPFGWLVAASVLAVLIVALVSWQYRSPSIDIPAKTLRVGLIADHTYAPTKLLANLLEYPVEASQKIALADRHAIEQLITNLGLTPAQSADDRNTISTSLGIDILLLLDAAPLSESQYQVSVAAVLMPANQYLFEVSNTVSNAGLGEGVAQLGKHITGQLLDAIEQPGAAPDLSYLENIASVIDSSAEATPEIQIAQLQKRLPDYPGGWLKGADLAFQNGDYSAAQQQLSALFALTDSNEYWQLRGKIIQAEITDDLDLAVQASERLLSLYPEHVEVLYAGAQIAEWADAPAKAMALYQQALAINQNNPQLWFELGRLNIIQGNISEALAGELTQALVAARRLGDTQAEGLILNAFGVAHLRLADYAQAERYFSDALVLRDANNMPEDRATTLANLANVAAINGHFDKAEEALHEASELLSKLGNLTQQAHIIDTLGFMYEEKGRYQKALEYYKQGLDLRTQSDDTAKQAESMSNVAYMHFLLGDYSLADIYWNQALNQFERINDQAHLMRTHQNLALMSMVKGDRRAAAKHLIKVDTLLSVNQTQEQMINQLFYSYLNFAQGKLKEATRNVDEARKLAEKSNDSRALLEVYLWHGEMCLRITDWACLSDQLALAAPFITDDMLEYSTLFGWLNNAYALEVNQLNSNLIQPFIDNLPYGQIPLTVELKVLLDLQERLKLPSNSELMLRANQLVKPIYYQSYMQWLYLNSEQDTEALRKLKIQLQGHPEHWRNHLYLTRFTDEYSRQQQNMALQQWRSQLSAEQAKQYEAHYF
ncbi:protein kinase domain-containing protein [Alteromonas sp. AMM-1]|uniref:protein kinase domain-containing protein n=1 Tax=Alteromonas sp. AMM-1 TaxID=3394233 RepID=UPI0039A5A4FC